MSSIFKEWSSSKIKKVNQKREIRGQVKRTPYELHIQNELHIEQKKSRVKVELI